MMLLLLLCKSLIIVTLNIPINDHMLLYYKYVMLLNWIIRRKNKYFTK